MSAEMEAEEAAEPELPSAIETRTKAALDEIQEADAEWNKLMSKGQHPAGPPGSQWDKTKGAWVMPS